MTVSASKSKIPPRAVQAKKFRSPCAVESKPTVVFKRAGDSSLFFITINKISCIVTRVIITKIIITIISSFITIFIIGLILGQPSSSNVPQIPLSTSRFFLQCKGMRAPLQMHHTPLHICTKLHSRCTVLYSVCFLLYF